MKEYLLKTVGLSTVFALSMPLIAIAEHHETDTLAGDETYPVREDMAMVSMQATVEAIDYELREVTLKGPGGNIFTVTAGPQVERLREVEAGDTVSVEYLTSMAFELREPSTDELAEPLVVLDAAAKAPAEVAPGAGAITVIRAVCSIEGLDRQTMTAKLLGPLGGYNIVSVADPANLTKLRIGDTVIVTYTEALAVMLKKVEDEGGVEEAEDEGLAEPPEHPGG